MLDDIMTKYVDMSRHPLVECEGVYEPGGGADDHQEITQGDRHQDRVGRGRHLGPEERHVSKIEIVLFFKNRSCTKHIFSLMFVVHHTAM